MTNCAKQKCAFFPSLLKCQTLSKHLRCIPMFKDNNAIYEKGNKFRCVPSIWKRKFWSQSIPHCRERRGDLPISIVSGVGIIKLSGLDLFLRICCTSFSRPFEPRWNTQSARPLEHICPNVSVFELIRGVPLDGVMKLIPWLPPDAIFAR